MAITPDGSTLVVAETLGRCLTRYDRAADGSLSNPTRFAALAGRAPDGICLDVDGCIWVADATAAECLRVSPAGEVSGHVETGMPSFSCALGGATGTTLFVATAPSSHHGVASAHRRGRIVSVEVEVPGSGSP
jgi:sugar lactone lactonase YvrE